MMIDLPAELPQKIQRSLSFELKYFGLLARIKISFNFWSSRLTCLKLFFESKDVNRCPSTWSLDFRLFSKLL